MLEKKKDRSGKRRMIGLTGGLIVLFGALASLFSVYDGTRKEELARLSEQLASAQEEIQELEWEKEEIQAQADAVTAMAMEEGFVPAEEIPFEVDLDDWKYLLVNETHPLPEDFEPRLAKTRNGQQVDRRIQPAVERMLDAAAKDGLNRQICASYRAYEKQDSLMDESIAKYLRQGMDYREAFFETKEQIALTGASEHHTGLAVDIVGKGHQSLDRAQANTKEAKWLSEHAHEYGFILRYPEDKEEITMISFESWHYRYVGVDAAAFMKENNLCLEEFVELAMQQQKQGKVLAGMGW